MRKFILSAILASSALGLVSTQGIAGSYGSSTSYQHAQYGGGWNGGGHREQCYWERKQVRIWDVIHPH